MKRRDLIVLSHVLIASIGFFGARMVGGAYRSDGGSHRAYMDHEAGRVTPEARPERQGGGDLLFRRPPSKQSRFRKAWDALPDQRLTKPERLKAQRRMLAEWAKFDLAGAMEMALTVPWDEGSRQTGPMASVFAEAFAEDPAGSWEMIQSGRFGLGASLLRRAWIDSIEASDPLTLVDFLPKGSWRDRRTMLSQLKDYGTRDPAMLSQIVDVLRNLPDDVVSASDLQPFVPQPSLEEITLGIANTDDFSSREGQLLTLQLVQHQSVELRQHEDPSEVAAIVRENMLLLPADAQGEFIHEVLAKSLPYEKGETGGRLAMALVDLLIEGEHWDLVGSSYSRRKVSRATGVPEKDRAEWALTLPFRDETRSLFHQSIKKYISNNPEESWEWVQGIQDGSRRDHALGEYASQAINKHKNYEGSRRALDQISDADYRQREEEKRPDWAKQLDK